RRPWAKYQRAYCCHRKQGIRPCRKCLPRGPWQRPPASCSWGVVAAATALLARVTWLDTEGAFLRVHLAVGIVGRLAGLLVLSTGRARERDVIDRGVPADDRAARLARVVGHLLGLAEQITAGLCAPLAGLAVCAAHPALGATAEWVPNRIQMMASPRNAF